MNHPTEYAYVMNKRPLPLPKEPAPVPAWTCGLVVKVHLDAPAGLPIAAMSLNALPDLPIYRDGEGGPDAATWSDFVDPNAAPLVLIPCTEEAYDYGLNVLWPALWEGPGFLVGEAWTHKADGRAAFQAFSRIGGKHYRGNVPLTRPEFRALTPATLAEAIARGAVA